MKKRFTLCLVLALLCACLPALADQPEYTLSKKGSTVLQNDPERDIDVQPADLTRIVVPGESPVTGLPWEGVYLPMLVQIGNDTDTVKVKGYSVKSAGIGVRSPWGAQYADIIYEEMLSRSGYTRLAMLFSDCFAQGEPATGVGPVRSGRIGPMRLREAWQGGLVYGGAMVGSYLWTDERMVRVLSASNAQERGLLINVRSGGIYNVIGYPVRGVKSPSNYNAYLIDIRNGIDAGITATPHPFLFQDGGAYGDGYETADIISLDWGTKNTISHFMYDSDEGVYYRYCGAGSKPEKWPLYTSFPTAEEREDDDRIPLSFANVIVQRVTYLYDEGSDIRSEYQCVGSGNADIFIGGKYIAGTWMCGAIGEPTVFYDDQGNELQLERGKTYIALFPVEGLCTFTAAD